MVLGVGVFFQSWLSVLNQLHRDVIIPRPRFFPVLICEVHEDYAIILVWVRKVS